MRVEGEPRAVEDIVGTLAPGKPPPKLELDESNVQQGLVRLVLALVELVRQLLERQALRRIDGGTLGDEQIERLGLTFLRLQEEMDRLKDHFHLTDEDLNLDLGPLGRTL